MIGVLLREEEFPSWIQKEVELKKIIKKRCARYGHQACPGMAAISWVRAGAK